MSSLLVWVMVATSATQPSPPPTQFPSLADCTRAVSVYTQNGKYPAYRYRCSSITVTNPYDTRAEVDYTDEAAAARRGQRNADYNQQKLDSIIRGH